MSSRVTMRYQDLETEEMDPEDRGFEPDLDDTTHMNFVDGRCNCCPYGYHIETDFMQFDTSLSSGQADLENLKMIRKNKAKLRKSMELMMSGTGSDIGGSVQHPDQIFNLVQYADKSTHRVLHEIDSSLDGALSSADMHSGGVAGRLNQDNNLVSTGIHRSGSNISQQQQQGDVLVRRSTQSQRSQHKFRTEAELSLDDLQGRSFSRGSASSAHSMDMPDLGHSSSAQYQQSTRPVQHHHAMEANNSYDSLDALFAVHSSTDASSPELVGLTPVQLQTIRQKLAASLEQIRELQEQNQNIPVLQARIEVLKEDHRMLKLQLKAKQEIKPNMRSIGIGDANVLVGDTAPTVISAPQGSTTIYTSETASGVKERELHTEHNTHIVEKEKEIQTLIIGSGSDESSSRFSGLARRSRDTKVPTRSIGVGSGNVFEATGNVHVHEKELRTVLIGNKDAGKQTRNVGILCKAAMRDVGVSYLSEDGMPFTRSVAIGVNELGMEDAAEYILGQERASSALSTMSGEGGTGSNKTTVYNQTTMLNQMNMAAFHTKNIHIKPEDLKWVIDQRLKRDVHSVGVMVRMATEDKAVQHEGYNMVNVSASDDNIDVEVRPIVQTKSVAVENRPQTVNHFTVTDRTFTTETGTNTKQEKGIERATNTSPPVTYSATTNTDIARTYDTAVETDKRVFFQNHSLKSVGENTDHKKLFDMVTNTEHPERTYKEDDSEMTFAFVNNSLLVTKEMYDCGIGTDSPRVRSTGTGHRRVTDPLECDRCAEKPRMKNIGLNTTTTRTCNVGIQAGSDIPRPEYAPNDETRSPFSVASPSRYEMRSSLNERPERTSPYGNIEKDKPHTFDRRPDARRDLTGTITTETRYGSREGPDFFRFDPITSETDGYGSGPSQNVPEQSDPGRAPSVTTETRYGLRQGRDSPRSNSGFSSQSTVTTETTRYGSRPVQDDPGRSDPRRSDPGRPDPGRSDPGRSDPGRSDPGRSDPGRSDPGRSDPGRSDPGRSSTIITETIRYDSRPGQDGPMSDPGRSEPDRSKPGRFEPGRLSSTTTETKQHGSRPGQDGPMSDPIRSSSITTETTRHGSRPVQDGPRSDPGRTSTITTETVRYPDPTSSTSETTAYGLHPRQELPSSTEYTSETSYSTSFGRHSPHSPTESNKASSPASASADGGNSLAMAALMGQVSTRSPPRPRSPRKETSPGRRILSKSEMLGESGSSSSAMGPIMREHQSSLEKIRLESDSSLSRQEVVSCPVPASPDMRLEGVTSPTQLRVVRTTETMYVGGQPVHRSSSVEMVEDEDVGGRSLSPQELRSIIRQQKGVRNGGKKISFAEPTVGGYVSSSAGEESGPDRAESSDTSFDEASYDGRIGRVTYMAVSGSEADDSRLTSQNIRESFEMPADLGEACRTYGRWCVNSTDVTRRELEAAMAVMQQQWFITTSHKLSEPGRAEDFLNAVCEISRPILQPIVNFSDANGNTAMHYAVSHGNVDMVSLLLDTELCDVTKQNKAGYTASMLASLAQIHSHRQREVFGRLLSHSDVNARASQAGQTALMLAVSHGRKEMVQLLLECGADVNAQDDDGSTALMCASEHGQAEIIKILLGHPDCDPAMKDNDGSSALTIAMEAGHRDVGVLLYAHTNFSSSPITSRSRTRRKVTSWTTSSKR